MRLGVLTGGGDCPGLNAVIRGVVKRGINEFGHEFVGIENGYQGLMEPDMLEEIIVSKNKGKEKLAVILPYGKQRSVKQRPLGILKGKATLEFKNGFKMTEQEFLNS